MPPTEIGQSPSKFVFAGLNGTRVHTNREFSNPVFDRCLGLRGSCRRLIGLSDFYFIGPCFGSHWQLNRERQPTAWNLDGLGVRSRPGRLDSACSRGITEVK